MNAPSILDRFQNISADMVRRFYHVENVHLFLHPRDYDNVTREATQLQRFGRSGQPPLGTNGELAMYLPSGQASIHACPCHVQPGRALLTWKGHDGLVRVLFWYLEHEGDPDLSHDLFSNTSGIFDPSTLLHQNKAPDSETVAKMARRQGPYRDRSNFAHMMRRRRSGLSNDPGSVIPVGCVLPPLLGEMNRNAWRRAVARGLGVDRSISALDESELRLLEQMIQQVTA